MLGAMDGTIRAWSLQTGALLATLSFHQPILHFDLTSDASRIVLQLRYCTQPTILSLRHVECLLGGVALGATGLGGERALDPCVEGKESGAQLQPGRRTRGASAGRAKLLRSLTMPAHVMGKSYDSLQSWFWSIHIYSYDEFHLYLSSFDLSYF